MRILYFEQITDDRFNNDIYNLLKERVNKIKELLNIDGLTVTTKDIKFLNFGTNKQCRCEFYVKKTNRKTTWNDIYKIINSVNAVPYKLK